MKLPNIESALVEKTKLIGYLLDEEKSGGKAAIFYAMGFTFFSWQLLQSALLNHANDHEVVQTLNTPHGVKYIIEGTLTAPDGRYPIVR